MDVPTYSTAATRALEIRWAGLKPPYSQGGRRARRAQSNEGVGGGSALSSMSLPYYGISGAQHQPALQALLCPLHC
jgi:hypothetical protein